MRFLIEEHSNPFPNSLVKDVVYHTSNKDFSKFSNRKKGSNTGWWDTRLGYFFSDNEEITKQFGNITKKYYLNIRKPLDLRVWRNIRAESFDDLSKEEKDIVVNLVKILGGEITDENLQTMVDNASDFETQNYIREYLSEKDARKQLYKMYDSIIDIMDRDVNALEYIVFSSNQIKLVESTLKESSILEDSKIRKDLKDLTGQVFGDLTVLEYDKEKSRQTGETYWKCKCSCGKICSVTRKHLLDGNTKSCGHGKVQSGLDHFEDNFKGMRDRQKRYNTNLEVIRNQKMQSNNTSGVKGVHFNKARNRWVASVSVGGKEIRRDFKTKEEAIAYRQELVKKYYQPKIDSAIEMGDLK